MSTKVIFRRAKVFVLAEVCLPRRPHAQTSSPLHPPLHEIFAFLSNIRPRLTCMRTSRKTSTRLKITFVDMTYPKGWTGSLPLCPLIFSCFKLLQNDPETGRIFSQPPLISFKCDKNVGNVLARSALKTNEQPGTFKCVRSR